jgi:hypothetical protein
MTAVMKVRNDLILALARSGVSRFELAAQFDITPQRVSQIVNQLGFGWR